MSQKVAHYLQQHVLGEVMTGKDALNYFSTDGSIFTVTPQVVVYPRNTSDVRKVARFTWQLAERGRPVPITSRGKGTDQGGAALGQGIMLVFPAHMHKILELDRETVNVQPGALFGKLEQTLHTHGRFIPSYPSSVEYSTIGGAVANNAAGEKSTKYGSTRKYVKSVTAVLANGELIKTHRLSKREVSKKKGLSTFEGEVYREMDALLTENKDLIEKSSIDVTRNSAGYDLSDVRRKDGSIDLTPLLVGSQGTLAIMTQITLKTEPYNPHTTLIAAYFDSIKKADDAIAEVAQLKPSASEIVDENLLDFLKKHNPMQLDGLVTEPHPAIIALFEFDELSDRNQKKSVKKAKKILQSYATEFTVTSDEHEKENLWKIRHSSAAVLWHTEGNKKPIPLIDDGIVPAAKLKEYLEKVYQLFHRHGIDVAVWGHASDANLHMQPFIDLNSVSDRQKIFKLANDYYDLVIKMGGSTSGEHNDGRLRGPYLQRLYGDEMYALFEKVKKIFDPYGTMNPGVKIGVSQKELVPLLRREFSIRHLYDHMPRM